MSDTPMTDNGFCPHCRSGRDLVLKSKMWSCGVDFSNPSFRTKACFRSELTAAQAEIVRLKAGGCARDQRTTQFCAEALALQQENAKLQDRFKKLVVLGNNMANYYGDVAFTDEDKRIEDWREAAEEFK